MLQEIRERAQGWFAWLIVAFISIPFALWGIQSYLDVSTNQPAAVVNGDEISQYELDTRLRMVKENLRQRLGANYRPEMFDDKLLAQQALEQMIEDKVLESAANGWKMRAGDNFVASYIQSIPNFQVNGHFDPVTYKNAIKNRGQSERSFEEDVRNDLVMSQLRNGITDTMFITERDLAESVRLSEQQREVAMLRLSASKLAESFQPDEAAINGYFDQHKSAFMQAEQVKIEYLVLEPDALTARVEVTDDRLRDYYSQHADEFFVPEERLVRHILIGVTESAPQPQVEAAEAKARDILARLGKGEDFAAVAKEVSEDGGSAANGGEVGWITENIGMAKAFKDAAFALALGKVSEPVRTPFGFHLIEVKDIKAGGKGDFDTLKAEIQAAYAKSEAEKLYYDQAEKLEDLLYQNAGGLKPVAEAMGLPLQESDWFDRSGTPSGLDSPKVTAEAFSEEVLIKGGNSQPVELGEDRLVVLRVVEHQAEQQKTLESVRDQVVTALKNEQGKTLAKAEGERLLAATEKGETSLQAAAESSGHQYVAAKFIGRRGGAIPQAVIAKAFEMKTPGSAKTSYQGVELPDGDYALLALSAVKDGDIATLDEAAKKSAEQRLRQRMGVAEFTDMTKYLRSKSDVEVTQQP